MVKKIDNEVNILPLIELGHGHAKIDNMSKLKSMGSSLLQQKRDLHLEDGKS